MAREDKKSTALEKAEAGERRGSRKVERDENPVKPNLTYFAVGSLLGLVVGYVLFEKRPRACNSCGAGLEPIRDPNDAPPGSSASLNVALAGMAEQGVGAFGGALAQRYVNAGLGKRSR